MFGLLQSWRPGEKNQKVTFKPLRTLFSCSLWCTSRRPSAGPEGKVISQRETIQLHVAEHTAGAADCHERAFCMVLHMCGNKNKTLNVARGNFRALFGLISKLHTAC